MLVLPLLRVDSFLLILWAITPYSLLWLFWIPGLLQLMVAHSNRSWCSGLLLYKTKHLGKLGKLCKRFTTLRTRLNLMGWVLIQLQAREVELGTCSPLFLRRGPFVLRCPPQSTRITYSTNEYLLLFLVVLFLYSFCF